MNDMKANELRIGNYVRHKEDVWSYRIDYWPKNKDGKTIDDPVFKWNESDWYQIGECCMSLDYIEPIQLTEEWLLKFNAVLHPWGWVLHEILIRWNVSNNKKKYWIELGNGKKIYLYYVHTIQNFFALTGTELELNENN